LSARSIEINEVVNTQIKIQDMENNMDENRDQMEMKMDENREQMENKMDENKDQMEKNMDELKISILQTLDERLLKSDTTEETHENKGSIHAEQPSSNKHFQVDLTLIVELIMDGFLRVLTFPKLN
jgi:hypothetical protein